MLNVIVYTPLLAALVLGFFAVRFFHRAAVREAIHEARKLLDGANRKVEVKVVGQDHLPWPDKLGGDALCGFLVMRFDSGSGWMREDAFFGPDAYVNAFNRVAKLRELMENNLRTEIRARLRRSPDISDFIVKPREIFIMPVVMVAAYVDPQSVTS